LIDISDCRPGQNCMLILSLDKMLKIDVLCPIKLTCHGDSITVESSFVRNNRAYYCKANYTNIKQITDCFHIHWCPSLFRANVSPCEIMGYYEYTLTGLFNVLITHKHS